MKLFNVFASVMILASCAACAPVVVGAAAGGAGGYYVAQRHGEDKIIIQRVLHAFENDDRLQNLKLDVDSEDSKVKLYGFVPTRQDEEYAMAVAGGVRGVKSVTSRITILPPHL